MLFRCLVLCFAMLAAPTHAARPNVLFIVCDDLNRHVTPAGYDQVPTPVLDELAATGVTFERAYCQYPVCGPSRASFLHGLYPESTGVIDNKADIRQTRPDTPSLPETFKRGGYWTAGVGKVFHTPRHDHGTQAWNAFGFFPNDELPVVTRAREAFEAEHGSISGRNHRRWKQAERRAAGLLTSQTPPGHGPSGLSDAQHKDGKNVRQVAHWLEQRVFGGQPFFIACGIQKPHVPFLAPSKYFDQFPPQGIRYVPNPEDDWEDVPPLALVKRAEAFGFEFGKENDSLRREYMQAYHACIAFVDAQLGRLFEVMKQNGYWENTIIVFTSDHGYHLGEHYLWGKVSLFEECARVPLIVRAPGITPAGARTKAMVEHVDFYPTLMDLCGLKPPPFLQGRSFVANLRDPSAPGRDDVYTVVSRSHRLGRAVRTQRWRYADWEEENQFELYDLQNDPRELKNLVHDPGHADILAEMRRRLEKRRRSAAAKRAKQAGLTPACR